jgi:isopentenyl-diphosphate delta-isomerase
MIRHLNTQRALAPGVADVEQVVLVDTDDVPVGVSRKLDAHVAGLLHRAFSVFVFDDDGRMLLQQRALSKYHSAGLWSNTCCSHPRPGEDVAAAAHRRLVEEMGFDCTLDSAFAFVYRADVGGGLIEHEYDHVFVGRFAGRPVPDPREVAAWRWIAPFELHHALRLHPDRFTFWFRIAWARLQARSVA